MRNRFGVGAVRIDMRTRTGRWITNVEKSRHLIRRLGSRDAVDRRVAQEEFLRMATDDPALFQADLADLIRDITGNRKRTSIAVAALVACFYVAYMAAMVLTALPQGMVMCAALLWTTAVLVPVGLTSFGIFRAILGRRKRRLAECITDLDDLNALPALVELLEFTNPAVRNTIIPPITRLLLRLRASDAHLLGFLHRSALARTLSAPRPQRLPASFFVAILQAFEQIGDSQALPAITWLAQGKGAARDHTTVQDAAQTCLAHLQAHISRQQAPYLLLRPSSAAGEAHALLRPVVSAPDAAPYELLRADNFPHA